MQPIYHHSFRSVSLILNPAIHSVDTLPLLVRTSQNSRRVDSTGSNVTCGISLLHIVRLQILDLSLTGTIQVCIEGFWNRYSHVPTDGNQHCSSAGEEPRIINVCVFSTKGHSRVSTLTTHARLQWTLSGTTENLRRPTSISRCLALASTLCFDVYVCETGET